MLDLDPNRETVIGCLLYKDRSVVVIESGDPMFSAVYHRTFRFHRGFRFHTYGTCLNHLDKCLCIPMVSQDKSIEYLFVPMRQRSCLEQLCNFIPNY